MSTGDSPRLVVILCEYITRPDPLGRGVVLRIGHAFEVVVGVIHVEPGAVDPVDALDFAIWFAVIHEKGTDP
jgi:hypothetical protein